MKFLHIGLSVVVYLSSIGYTLNAHYCNGRLIDLQLFLPAKPCDHYYIDLESLGHDLSELKPCCIEALVKEHRSCCSDVTEWNKDDQKSIIKDKNELSNFDFSIADDWLISNQLFIESAKVTHFSLYRPPPLLIDFQAFFQIYII